MNRAVIRHLGARSSHRAMMILALIVCETISAPVIQHGFFDLTTSGIAAKPSAEFDADWGGGFMQPDVWIGIVYDGMTKN